MSEIYELYKMEGKADPMEIVVDICITECVHRITDYIPPSLPPVVRVPAWVFV